MEIVIWLAIIGLFVLSFVGIIFPIIPSVLMIWGGFVLYHFYFETDELRMLFWISMGILTIIMFVSDFIANSYFVKKYGGSKSSEIVSTIGIIVGAFLLPPLGIIIFPFIMVIITEKVLRKTWKEASLIGVGSIIGFLSSSVAKGLIQLIMITWFTISVIL